MWAIPATALVVGGVTAAVVGGYCANENANPYQTYSATPVGSSNSDFIQVYFASAVNGTRLLLLPGYSHTSPMTQALGITEANNQPIYSYMNKTGFLLMDDSYGMPIFNSDNQVDTTQIQPVWGTHVGSVQFRTDLGSFIVGIAAGEFLNEYQYYFAPNEGDQLTWATYGGDSFSSVTGYMGGLQRGIRWFNEHIVPYAKTADGKPFKPLHQIFLGSDYNSNFTNGFGATDGNTLISNFLMKKVDLLVPVAGGQTQQATRMIKQNQAKTVILGVDSACEDDTNSNLSLYKPGYQDVNGSTAIGGTNNIIQFSSIKNLNKADFQMMTNVNAGITTPEAGKTIGGFGYQSVGTTENQCVGLSPAGYQYFIRAMELFSATYDNKVGTPEANQTHVSQNMINQIFAIPNNNPETNIPTSKEYHEYWSEQKYDKWVDVINELPSFQQMNEAKNKVYYAYNDWQTGTPANNSNSWSYANLPNSGKQMMPTTTDPQVLTEWYKNNDRINPDDDGTSKPLTADDQTRLQSLIQWTKDNATEIKQRQDFNLKGVLTKANYEKNHSLIKVVVSTPVSPLLDKGFCESAYLGLVDYWKKMGVIIPRPNNE